jgi:hypothetical protein
MTCQTTILGNETLALPRTNVYNYGNVKHIKPFLAMELWHVILIIEHNFANYTIYIPFSKNNE